MKQPSTQTTLQCGTSNFAHIPGTTYLRCPQFFLASSRLRDCGEIAGPHPFARCHRYQVAPRGPEGYDVPSAGRSDDICLGCVLCLPFVGLLQACMQVRRGLFVAVHKLRPMEAIRCAATTCSACACSLEGSSQRALHRLALSIARSPISLKFGKGIR